LRAEKDLDVHVLKRVRAHVTEEVGDTKVRLLMRFEDTIAVASRHPPLKVEALFTLLSGG
jgi:hypothetical protein